MRPFNTLSSIVLMLASAISPAPAAAEELVVYSARKEELIKPLLDDFTKQTGVKVTLLSDDSPKLIARLESEGARSPADVLLTVDVMNAELAAGKTLLEPVKSDILENNVPAQFRDTEGKWFGLSKRARIVFYNKDKVKPEMLSTYEALAEPQWKGKLITRSSSNVYSQSLIASMVATHGEKDAESWAKNIAANLATPPKGGDMDLIKAVGAGAADVAIANTYYYVRLLHSTVPGDKELMQKVGVFFPNQQAKAGQMQGVHVNISTGAVLAASDQKAEAQQLLEFLSGEQAQRFYADSNHEYPMNPNVAPSETLASLGKFKADATPMAELARYAKTAILIADRAGWK